MIKTMENELSTPQDLIELAFDPSLAEKCGQLLVQCMTEHLRQVQSGDAVVQHWVDPQTNVKRAAACLDSSVELDASSLPDQFESLVRKSLQSGQNLNHPRYIGHQVPAPIPLVGLFDAVTTMTNQVQGVYEMGPWGVAAERAVIEKIGAVIGFEKGKFGGLVTSGGSLGNLTALLAARNRTCPEGWKHGVRNSADGSSEPPVLVVQSDAHYCVDRAAGVMGIGTERVIRVPLDSERCMDVVQLDRILNDLRGRGVPVVAVVAVASSTPTGAFDPLHEIADICERHSVWMHVDAAHGGPVCFSRKHRHLVSGLERADSLVFDAHKMMFLPAVCALVFYKNRDDRFVAFQQSAPYLFDPSAPDLSEYDNGVVTFECTKRAAALGLWGTLSLFGTALFEQMVDHVFAVAARFDQILRVDPNFETYGVPAANILVFRYLPNDWNRLTEDQKNELQWAIRRRLLQNGFAYLTQTRLHGAICLRSTIMNPLTQERDLLEIVAEIKRVGEELASELLGGANSEGESKEKGGSTAAAGTDA